MVATPPFNISTSDPADNAIVSQFPANERTNRDNINQWLLTDHDTNGDHVKMTMPYQGSVPTTPAASFLKIYADVNGNLAYVAPDGLVRYVGVPPGAVAFTAGATPDVGWVLANGGTVLRTGVGAALFARIGTQFGAGDTLTNFNVPDIRGRVIAGVDAGTGRLTGMPAAGAFSDQGGSPTQTLGLSQIPTGITSNGNNTINVAYTATTVPIGGAMGSIVPSGGAQAEYLGGTTTNSLASVGVNTIIVTSNNTSGLSHPNIQATIVLNAQIKL